MTDAETPAVAAVAPVRTGLFLAVVAGYTDAACFVALLGVFVSHMSGTSTRLAVEVGRGHWFRALPFVVVVLAFFAGSVASSLYLGARPRRALQGLLAVEALLLAVVAAAGVAAAGAGDLGGDTVVRLALGGPGAFAMGIQAAAVRRATGITVNTTYVSGMLTHAGERAAAWLRGDPEARRAFAVHGGVWAGFVAGGAAGAFAVTRWGIGVLGAAAAALAALALTTGRSPAAAEP